ncbi:hypothetical protein MTBPR1_30111 [Candidatus Terasakiella magnetica]|uniref:Glycine zipper domain-containing protein n=1 Tax=Candidatus Terasakiella magnetica TaxID=1867952 RepID=A0A1C3RHK0_9PROT|nr:hypothetical protein [Candidatus Terasakiella magnetica]SCA56741.1 hypothetical protein MTBPR1_30111 [Candidatus Terasakiella magnetica]
MSFKIFGKAEFSCSKCGKPHSLQDNDFDFEAINHEERQMGQETEYESHHHLECDNCNNDIELKFNVWEYPAEAFNHDDYSSSGAQITQSNFHFNHVENSPPEDKDRLIGAAAGGAILGASLGGPFGALIGGAVGAILGDSVNKSKKGGKHG